MKTKCLDDFYINLTDISEGYADEIKSLIQNGELIEENLTKLIEEEIKND